MRNLYYSFTVIFSLFLFLSCSTESTPVYQLSVDVDPTEAGSVSPSSGEFEEGESVQVTASANEHWVFDRWQGDHTGTSNPASISMNSDKSLTALFKRLYPLTVNVEGSGNVSERVVQQKTTDYSEGTVVELTANPDTGWEFDSWEGDLSGSENPQSITLDNGKEVLAKFVEATYTINTNVEGEGSVTFSPEKEEYLYGEEVTIKANPADGWNFVYWDGDLDGTESEVIIEIESDLQITAVLDESPFEGGNGSAEYPYLVSTIEQIQAVNDFTRSHFLQINDIDATETMNWNDGRGFEPIGDETFKFQGIYDGSNFEIINLYMNNNIGSENPDYEGGSNFGLFSNNVGILKNIRLVDVSITGGRVGAVVGENSGEVINVYVSGILSGGSVGGVVGYNYRGSIINAIVNVEITGNYDVGGIVGSGCCGSYVENSTVVGDISGSNNVGGVLGSHPPGNVIRESSFIGNVNGDRNIGGIVGYGNGNVIRSFADASVIGEENVGGIIGIINYQYGGDLVEDNYFLGIVEGVKNVGGIIGMIDREDIILYNSFAIGEVKGSENVGGLIGTNVGDMENSFWNIESTGQVDPVGLGYSDGATGLSTSEMQGASVEENMPEFDWINVWKTTDGYPILRWQEE